LTSIEKLLSLSSEALGAVLADSPSQLTEYSLGQHLYEMLKSRNGFYAFEGALHVFPIAPKSRFGLEEWNSQSLWRNQYDDLAEGLLFFAEDALQDQFCLSKSTDGVLRFHAETGQIEIMAESFESWARVILDDSLAQTGWPLLHQWQQKNGVLSEGMRLLPRVPFFLGGEYGLANLWAGDAAEGMRLKGDIAIKTRNLPKGAKVRLQVDP
jgi:hypothetical protein